MTTIIYSKEAEAFISDGRETEADGTITTETRQKIYTLGNGDVIAACGVVSLIDRVMALWEDAPLTLDALDVQEDENLSAFVYLRSIQKVKQLHITNRYIVLEPIDYTYSIGSGAKWALAALDFNECATQAIEYAASRDCYTGTEVAVVCLGDIV